MTESLEGNTNFMPSDVIEDALPAQYTACVGTQAASY
jgi:hypothetical protein